MTAAGSPANALSLKPTHKAVSTYYYSRVWMNYSRCSLQT